MEPERWRRVEEIFERALEVPPPQRDDFLSEATAGDADLRSEVDALLEADASSDAFLAEPVVEGGISRFLKEDSDSLAMQDHLGPYRLLRKLGEGGMSQVYLAVRDDDEYQKLVAVKVIRQGLDREDILRRFRTERQILANLDHPNIAKLLDGGTTESGLPYFVMDYIEGVPIDEYCDRNRLSLTERLQLFRVVCSAIQYAHQNLVVHRDIKTSNILVTSDGVPKLLDFGIAKLLKPGQFPVPVEFTATRLRPMTPSYASPEQIQGKLITTASDIYSLGVLLYKLLTGHLPYRLESKTPREMERAILEEQPEPPSTVVARPEHETGQTGEIRTPPSEGPGQPSHMRRMLRGDLDNIVLMALRKEPQRRYASAEMFSEDLRRHMLGLPVLAHKDSLRYRTGKFLRRNAWGIAVAAAFALLLIGTSILTSIQNRRIKLERDQAQRERDRAEQVVEFLQEIFQVSDPAEGGGETITAREILDLGARRIEQELTGQPVVQASLMEAIGNVYRNLGLYDWAEPLLERSLKLRQEALGLDHPDIAVSLSSLGILRDMQGDYEGAEPLLREALERRTRDFGSEHPLVAESLHNLARLYHDKGDFLTAERLYRQALEVRSKVFGPDHLELSEDESYLGILLSQQSEFEEAERLFRHALETRRRWLGADHPRIADSLNNLGVLLGIQGRHEEVESLFREALELRRRVLGPDHPEVGQSLNNLARLLRERGDFDSAEKLYRDGLERSERLLGSNHPQVAAFKSNLAVTLLERGRYDESERLFRQALETRRKLLVKSHPDLGATLIGLSRLLLRKGEPKAAEPLILEAIEGYQTGMARDHWRFAEAQSLLGECYASQRMFEEAEPLLLEGYHTMARSLGEPHRRSQEALDRLLRLYEKWNRPDKLAEYRAVKRGTAGSR